MENFIFGLIAPFLDPKKGMDDAPRCGRQSSRIAGSELVAVPNVHAGLHGRAAAWAGAGALGARARPGGGGFGAAQRGE